MIRFAMIGLFLSTAPVQEYYDYLRSARNPFQPLSQSGVVETQESLRQPSVNVSPAPIQPELIQQLDQLKSIVLTKKGRGLLYLGNEIMSVRDRLFGFPVVLLTLEKIVLQDEFYRIEKVIGQPVSIHTISKEDG